MAPPEVRRLTADDLPALTREVDRARAAGEFRASSDDGANWFARNERALGLYESEGFVRTRTRERWARPVDGGPAARGTS